MSTVEPPRPSRPSRPREDVHPRASRFARGQRAYQGIPLLWLIAPLLVALILMMTYLT